MKKSLQMIFGLSALALLVTATPVLAAEVDVTAANEETGADSTNTNDTEIDNGGDVDVDNDADVKNNADADVDTGDNEQNKNTTGGDLTAGDVEASTEWETVVNEGFDLCGCPGGENGDHEVSADFLNRLTGFDSVNRNQLVVDHNGDIRVDNDADIDNDLDLKAKTGDNEQNMNTTAGDLESGSVMGEFAISNWANVSDDDGDSDGGSMSVDVEASNDTTGAESRNTNTVRLNHSGSKQISNNADVNNDIDVDANTGGNQQNKNTTAGSLTSGDVEVSTDIQNVVNAGSCCVRGGNHSVSADLSNDTTGYDSRNENNVEINNSGDHSVENDADVENNLKVDANTGDNEQNMNTSGGDVESGSVSIDFSSTTVANSSSN